MDATEYLKNAKDCMDSANRCIDPDQKAWLLELAKEWSKLAAEIETLLSGSNVHWIAVRQVEEYRKHAEECRAMATKATDPQRQKAMLELAATWDYLADQRQRLLETRQRFALRFPDDE